MPSDSKPLTERVAGAVQHLTLVATDLNKASNELGLAIGAIDVVLQSLSIGISTWTTIESGDGTPDDTRYWSRDLGYAKVGKKWGISLRDVSGDYNWPDEESCDLWLFDDAPRWLRIKSISKIPELLEALIKNTEETTEKIKIKTAEANQLATAIAQAASGKNPLMLDLTESLVVGAKKVTVVPKRTETVGDMAKKTTHGGK